MTIFMYHVKTYYLWRYKKIQILRQIMALPRPSLTWRRGWHCTSHTNGELIPYLRCTGSYIDVVFVERNPYNR